MSTLELGELRDLDGIGDRRLAGVAIGDPLDEEAGRHRLAAGPGHDQAIGAAPVAVLPAAADAHILDAAGNGRDLVRHLVGDRRSAKPEADAEAGDEGVFPIHVGVFSAVGGGENSGIRAEVQPWAGEDPSQAAPRAPRPQMSRSPRRTRRSPG